MPDPTPTPSARSGRIAPDGTWLPSTPEPEPQLPSVMPEWASIPALTAGEPEPEPAPTASWEDVAAVLGAELEEPAPEPEPMAEPRRRRGVPAFIVLAALVAIAGVAYVGWKALTEEREGEDLRVELDETAAFAAVETDRADTAEDRADAEFTRAESAEAEVNRLSLDLEDLNVLLAATQEELARVAPFEQRATDLTTAGNRALREVNNCLNAQTDLSAAAARLRVDPTSATANAVLDAALNAGDAACTPARAAMAELDRILRGGTTQQSGG